MPNYSIELQELSKRIRPVMRTDTQARIMGKGDISFALSLLALEGFRDDIPWGALELANQRFRLERQKGFSFVDFKGWWQLRSVPPEPEDRAYISFVGYQFSLQDRLFSDEVLATAIDTYYYRTAIQHPGTSEIEASLLCQKTLWVLVENLIYRHQLNNGKAC